MRVGVVGSLSANSAEWILKETQDLDRLVVTGGVVPALRRCWQNPLISATESLFMFPLARIIDRSKKESLHDSVRRACGLLDDHGAMVVGRPTGSGGGYLLDDEVGAVFVAESPLRHLSVGEFQAKSELDWIRSLGTCRIGFYGYPFGTYVFSERDEAGGRVLRSMRPGPASEPVDVSCGYHVVNANPIVLPTKERRRRPYVVIYDSDLSTLSVRCVGDRPD